MTAEIACVSSRSPSSLYVHSGVTGVANATAELLAQLAGVAYYIITFHSYAEILESVIEQFHIENAIHRQDEAQIRKAYCFYPVARTTLCRATLVPSRSNCTNCAFFCAQSKLIIPLGGNASWRILENAIVEAVIRVLLGSEHTDEKGNVCLSRQEYFGPTPRGQEVFCFLSMQKRYPLMRTIPLPAKQPLGKCNSGITSSISTGEIRNSRSCPIT